MSTRMVPLAETTTLKGFLVGDDINEIRPFPFLMAKNPLDNDCGLNVRSKN